MRLIATLAVATTLAVALVGCSTPPAAVPTPTPSSKAAEAAAQCTPSTAKIQWSLSDTLTDPRHPTYVATGVTLLEYSHGAPAETSSSQIAPVTEVDYSEPSQIVTSSRSSESAWRTALLTSVRLTGQVPTDFGGKYQPNGDSVTVDTHHGKFLDVEEQILTRVPFSISCAGQKAIQGSIVGPESGAFRGEVVECGQKAGRHSDQAERIALALMPKYCAPSS